EDKFAKYCEVSHAIAVNSATSALHLACLALGVGEDDVVWTSPITFVASANCALYCGASVDFVDIDSVTYNMCPEKLSAKLRDAAKNGVLPKVVIPVHLTGQSCDMEKIHILSEEYGFQIIEDASHAVGGLYKEESIGSCKYSDICVFSFHPVKIITTGEGGMILTNNSVLANKMARLRSHGITRDPASMTNQNPEPWYYEQIELGLNYRMTDLQAALGISQMARLDEYVAVRNQLAQRYDALLADFPLTIPFQSQDCYSSRHLYVIRLNLEEIDRSRRQVFEYLREHGVGVQIHYIPVPCQPYYKNMGFCGKNYPNGLSYYQEAISIPLFPTMTTEQQDKVVAVLREALMP
ncbi:UDP-4-amino-4,6-dideoxy-N-acetyl-beta-L-altrosamine transaminase, partial [Porticoccaceae bacterium]|nr:UDP-4-amino-4,6-dideoxy-N-acetyl-beta-L-altrosamine transaminase [Porticoccaceae bacterium]